MSLKKAVARYREINRRKAAAEKVADDLYAKFNEARRQADALASELHEAKRAVLAEVEEK